MIEIKCNIFSTDMALKWIVFSNVYISVNAMFECCYLFFGWKIGHLLNTYATGEMEEGSKICTGTYREWELKNWSWDTHVLNGWPQTNFVKYFLYIGLAKYTRASLPVRKMLLFSSIIITIILPYVIIIIYSPSSIFESPQKHRHSIFLKKILTQMFV